MSRWLRRLWYLLNRRTLERELEREMAAHRAMMSDPRRFGSTLRLREESADAWGWTWLERLAQDVQYAARLLRRRPVLSATAVLTLMLGMGGTTAVFSLIDVLHLRRLPVENPDALVRFAERSPDGTLIEAFTLVTHDTLQRATRTLSGVIASATGRFPGEIDVDGERRSAFLQLVSDNYFDVLGVRLSRGRVFHPPVPGVPGEALAVISDDYWRRQYGADPSVLGTRFRSGTREFAIAGIAPPGFRGAELDVPADIWMPVDQVVAPDDDDRFRGRWMRIMGRLQPGVTPAQAEAEATAFLGRPVQLTSGGVAYSGLRRRLDRPLLLMALVVALVLLIACANLANLMMAADGLTRARDGRARRYRSVEEPRRASTGHREPDPGPRRLRTGPGRRALDERGAPRLHACTRRRPYRPDSRAAGRLERFQFGRSGDGGGNASSVLYIATAPPRQGQY